MSARIEGIAEPCHWLNGLARIAESVDVQGVAAARKVALFDEGTLTCLRVAWSDATTGAVAFEALAADTAFLLVAFDHEELWASPTVRRVATPTGARP